MIRRILKSLVLLVLVYGVVKPAVAESDVAKKTKEFCDTKVKLTEQNISFSVQKLISLSGSSKSSATLDSVSAVQISTMRLNCSLLVGGYITPDQFLAKQTEILQFAVDLQAVRQIAEAKASSANSSKDDTSKSTKQTASGSSSSSSGQSIPSTSTNTKGSKNSASGKTGTSAEGKEPSAAITSIQDIARDLGVTVTIHAGTVQSGSEDYVDTAMTRLISSYSAIPVSQ